jgi:HSP20 family protein
LWTEPLEIDFRLVVSSYEWGGVSPFLHLQREMKRMFDDLRFDFGTSLLGEASEGALLMPRLEIRESDKDMRVIAELPGVSEKDIDVSLDDDVLTIRAEKQSEHTGEKENTHFSERAFGTFQRSMRLPYRVEPNELKATFADGVLTVTIRLITALLERYRKKWWSDRHATE